MHRRTLVLFGLLFPLTIYGDIDSYEYGKIQYIPKTTHIIKIADKEYRYRSATLMIEDLNSTTSTLIIDDFKVGDSIDISFKQGLTPTLTRMIVLAS